MKNIRIHVSNFYLVFDGMANDAYHFVNDLREAATSTGWDMGKVLSDFLFAIECELQNIGYLDKTFNKVEVPDELTP